MTVVVCVKWARSAIEPDDDRFAGVSPADEAALELALRDAAVRGDDVMAITVGSAEADGALRRAASVGVRQLVRIAVSGASAPNSATVAAAMARVIVEERPSRVWCGDYSADRGSGSVPAFLAHHLNAAQLLGLVSVEAEEEVVRGVRRLDGGRREVISAAGLAVVSVEGSVARLRRAPVSGVVNAPLVPIHLVIDPLLAGNPADAPTQLVPYRPRPRACPAPEGSHALDRLRSLTNASADAEGRGESFAGPPVDAAARIVAALDAWGYLDDGPRR